MSNNLHLALRLEGPLQSWGYEDRYNRRNTGLLPTKSGVLGICCAAMGIPRGSERERKELPLLAALNFLSLSDIPPRSKSTTPATISRMEDFHTIQNTRKADGKIKDTHITYRTYLCDARNGAILSGNADLLTRLAESLQDPVWGMWLGRKACIPSAPVFAGLFPTEAEALVPLLGDRPLSGYLYTRDEATLGKGTDALLDHPITYSGVRQFTSRRIHLHRPGQI